MRFCRDRGVLAAAAVLAFACGPDEPPEGAAAVLRQVAQHYVGPDDFVRGAYDPRTGLIYTPDSGYEEDEYHWRSWNIIWTWDTRNFAPPVAHDMGSPAYFSSSLSSIALQRDGQSGYAVGTGGDGDTSGVGRFSIEDMRMLETHYGRELWGSGQWTYHSYLTPAGNLLCLSDGWVDLTRWEHHDPVERRPPNPLPACLDDCFDWPLDPRITVCSDEVDVETGSAELAQCRNCVPVGRGTQYWVRGDLYFVDFATDEVIGVIKDVAPPIGPHVGEISPDGTLFAAMSTFGFSLDRIHGTESAHRIGRAYLKSGGASKWVTFSRGGRYVFIAHDARVSGVSVFDTETLTDLGWVEVQSEDVGWLVVSADGRRLFAFGELREREGRPGGMVADVFDINE
jgi:hypothetical protein